MFETVWATVNFSRGLFGKTADPAFVEQILRELSLWEKKDSRIATLSGGMKRRLLIAKALAHEPTILFLDEPTAGVDVELRRDMWAMVRRLREKGVTIILTTHYIEEAEEMADRVGVIDHGQDRAGRGKARPDAQAGADPGDGRTAKRPLDAVPPAAADLPLVLSEDGMTLSPDRVPPPARTRMEAPPISSSGWHPPASTSRPSI